VELNIPPLRERREDILPLAALFIGQFTQGRARFSSAVTDCLVAYAWPGNVRELRNVMERAALVCRGEMVLPEHLPARLAASAATSPSPANHDTEKLEDIERETILRSLKEHDFNRTETAKALGISRRTLVYRLQHFRALGLPVDPE